MNKKPFLFLEIDYYAYVFRSHLIQLLLTLLMTLSNPHIPLIYLFFYHVHYRVCGPTLWLFLSCDSIGLFILFWFGDHSLW